MCVCVCVVRLVYSVVTGSVDVCRLCCAIGHDGVIMDGVAFDAMRLVRLIVRAMGEGVVAVADRRMAQLIGRKANIGRIKREEDG